MLAESGVHLPVILPKSNQIWFSGLDPLTKVVALDHMNTFCYGYKASLSDRSLRKCELSKIEVIVVY